LPPQTPAPGSTLETLGDAVGRLTGRAGSTTDGRSGDSSGGRWVSAANALQDGTPDNPALAASGSSPGLAAGAAARETVAGKAASTQFETALAEALAGPRASDAALGAAAPGRVTGLGDRAEAGPGPTAAAAAAAAIAAAAATNSPGLGLGSAALEISLPTPLTAPDFTQALGLQVSLLARGGLQQAELQLNPPEMGPVSVQIAMEGTQARVEFGADLAATRQVLEAGMPDLASALSAAGFTLAGGGVSQHAGGRGRGNDADAASPHPTLAAVAGAGSERQRLSEESAQRLGAAARRALTRGGVDLFA
jgi:hypothetical protein